MKEAVIYARVSSKDQEREGYSIPAQRKTLMEYAPKNGFKIVREFVDVETAKCAGREQFGEMIAFLRNSSQCCTVIVEKTDRLSISAITSLWKIWASKFTLRKKVRSSIRIPNPKLNSCTEYK